jgi:hypothetical protein
VPAGTRGVQGKKNVKKKRALSIVTRQGEYKIKKQRKTFPENNMTKTFHTKIREHIFSLRFWAVKLFSLRVCTSRAI